MGTKQQTFEAVIIHSLNAMILNIMLWDSKKYLNNKMSNINSTFIINKMNVYIFNIAI